MDVEKSVQNQLNGKERNNPVLKETGEHRRLRGTTQRRKTTLFGHILWCNYLQNKFKGKILGKKGKERRQTNKWYDTSNRLTKLSSNEAERKEEGLHCL